MTYLLVLALAFFTKPFLNSKLCSGELGFFRTFFVFGLGGVVAISILVFWLFGSSQIEYYRGADKALYETFRIWILFSAVYMAGIGLALYRIKEKGVSPLMSLYINIQLVSVVLLLLVAAGGAMVYSVIYAISVGALYSTVWQKTLINKQAA